MVKRSAPPFSRGGFGGDARFGIAFLAPGMADPAKRIYSSGMPSVFNFYEYRDFLREFYEERKRAKAAFSYRFMAGKVGLHATHLIRIFQKKRHLDEESLPPFFSLCGFNDREASYFAALVAYNKSRSDRDKRMAWERLLKSMSVETRALAADQFELFRHWYYGAVRVLLSFHPFKGDFRDLAGRMSPPITVAQARKAVALLERLGLIAKREDGAFRLTDQFISTGAAWKNLAVRDFQSETLRLARESLERHDKEERDISTVTIAVSRKALPELKDRIAEFRKSLLGMVKESPDYDEVYQFNVQLFPLTQRPETGA
jgi:uncharacterized protein (TIGR02147 family)